MATDIDVPRFESIASTPEALRPVCEYAASLSLWAHAPATWRAILPGGSNLYVCVKCHDALRLAAESLSEFTSAFDGAVDTLAEEGVLILDLEEGIGLIDAPFTHPPHVVHDRGSGLSGLASWLWGKIVEWWQRLGTYGDDDE